MVNFLLGIVLLLKIREALKDKKNKFAKMMSEKRRDEYVIKNLVCFIQTCLPASFVSFNDLRLLSSTQTEHLEFEFKYAGDLFEFPYSLTIFKNFSIRDSATPIFSNSPNFANFLYLISVSISNFYDY